MRKHKKQKRNGVPGLRETVKRAESKSDFTDGSAAAANINATIKKILLPNVETFTLEHQFGISGKKPNKKKHNAAYGHRMYNRAKKRIRRGIRYPL